MTLPISEPISQQENEEGIIAQAEGGEELKFCVECKWLLGVRHKTEMLNEWKCVHSKNVIKSEKRWDLVTGIQHYIREFVEADIKELRTRDGMGATEYCGPSGRWYEKYERPSYQEAPREPTIGGKTAKLIPPTEEVFKPADLQAQKDAAAKRVEELRKRKSGG